MKTALKTKAAEKSNPYMTIPVDDIQAKVHACRAYRDGTVELDILVGQVQITLGLFDGRVQYDHSPWATS